jgi:hypothetical protein
VCQHLGPEGFFREVAEDSGFSFSSGFLIKDKQQVLFPNASKFS